MCWKVKCDLSNIFSVNCQIIQEHLGSQDSQINNPPKSVKLIICTIYRCETGVKQLIQFQNNPLSAHHLQSLLKNFRNLSINCSEMSEAALMSTCFFVQPTWLLFLISKNCCVNICYRTKRRKLKTQINPL